MKYIDKENEKNIKFLKSLNMKKYRQKYMAFFDEGEKNILSSIDSSYKVDKLFISEDFQNKNVIDSIEAREKYLLSTKIFKKVSDTVNSQGIIASFNYKNREILELDTKRVILLDKIQDPGNMGAIIRSAHAFGFKDIVLSHGTVDVYSPKVVRASMGSIYKVNFYYLDNIEHLKSLGYKIISTSLETDKSIEDIDLRHKSVLVFGNESKGVSNDIIENSDQLFKIRMRGDADSLNVSIATSIVLYEVSKRYIII